MAEDEYTQSIYHDDGADGEAVEKPAEAPAETGAVSFVTNPDGTMTFTKPDGEVLTVEDPAKVAEAEKVQASNGAALLAQVRARRGNLIEPFEHDGVTWWLLKMDYGTTNLVAATTVRQGDGTLSLDHTDVFQALVKSVLQNGVVKGERDREPFFDPTPKLMDDADGNVTETTELEELMKEPEMMETIAVLFDKLTDLNPQVWPAKKKVLERGAEILGIG